jgi:hypothetical protein
MTTGSISAPWRDTRWKLAMLQTGSPEIDESDLTKELVAWQSEIAFVPGAIAVRPFFLPDRWIGTAELPEHYQEVLDHPERFDEQRRRLLEEDIHRWREQGDFVLYWVEDYYLTRDGELTSS